MREPTPRTSRFAIAGGLAAALVLGGVGFLLGRATNPPPPAAPTAPAVITESAPVKSAVPTRALGRKEIAVLAAEAADALVGGRSTAQLRTDVVGRKVDVVIPFGCDGPAAAQSNAPLRWRYDEASEVLRVRVEPTAWQSADWGLEATAAGQAIRGFWVSRPWATGDRCPVPSGQPAATDVQAVTLPGQTLAVADFAAQAAPAGARPYQIIQRVAPDALDMAAGLRLRITGRVGRVPGGGPVRCIQPAGIDQNPICVVAIRPDELRIERIADGTVLATWSLATD